jgi:hypothetical protein
VPYLASLEALGVNNGTGTAATDGYGIITITQLLRTDAIAGLTVPTYELYVNLENLKLVGATTESPATLVPQSGSIVSSQNRELKEDSYPFSSAVSHVSKAVTLIGKGVPFIKPITEQVSWYADLISGVVRYFGFSKPQVLDPPMRIIKQTNASETNVDIPASTYVVGPLATNTLNMANTAGMSEVDEMSLSFVLGRYSQICIGSVTTADTHGSAIYAGLVGPYYMWYRQPAGAPYGNTTAPRYGNITGNSFYPSIILDVCQMFRSWKGSFTYRFTFAKTKFHAGRYMATFIPQEEGNRNDFNGTLFSCIGPQITSGFMQPFGYSAIFDLKDDNVFEFVVPFTSNTPYKMFQSQIGSISLSALDPLVASGTVSTSVQFMVEVKANDDFEPADYCGLKFVNGPVVPILITQSSIVVSNIPADASQHCVGEKVTSLKQLIMIPVVTGGAQNCTANTNIPKVVRPWYSTTVFTNLPSPPLNSTNLTGLSYTPGHIAKRYAFVKGSTEIHAYCRDAGMWLGAQVTTTPGISSSLKNNAINLNMTSPSTLPTQIATDGSALHLRLPSYQLVSRIPGDVGNTGNYTFWFGTTGVADPSASDYVNNFVSGVFKLIFFPSFTGTTFFVTSRCAADDATMGHYIGPTPLLSPNLNPVSALDPTSTFADSF